MEKEIIDLEKFMEELRNNPAVKLLLEEEREKGFSNKTKKKMIGALNRIKEMVLKIETNKVVGEGNKNQIIGYCDGLIKGLEDSNK